MFSKSKCFLFILVLALLGSGCDREKSPVGSNTPPGSPSLARPANSSQVADNTPAFDWSDVSSAVGYEVQVDDTTDFVSPLIDAYPSGSDHTDTLVLGDGTYFWRVRARNSSGLWGDWSLAWSFVVVPVGTPVLKSPPDGSGLTDDTPLLDWDDAEGAVSYEVQVDNTNDFGSPVVQELRTASIYEIGSPLSAGVYYWRIRGKNSQGTWGDWSQVWSFTVAPYRFALSWGSRGTGNGQFERPRAITIDGSGNVYVADSGNHRIQKFTASGTFLLGWGSDGQGNGEFNWPSGIAVDGSGYVYVADTYNHRIQKFTSEGVYVRSWGSFGSNNGQFDRPTGLAADGSGFVYVADLGNNCIQKFSSEGMFVFKRGSVGTKDGDFDEPSGIAVGGDGYIFIADSQNRRVQKFHPFGYYAAKWGSQGAGDYEFQHPYGVSVDGSGNVYVADSGNHRVQKFNPSGVFVTKWGFNGAGSGEFNEPRDVAVDGPGNVYVVDTGNHRIQKFEPR